MALTWLWKRQGNPAFSTTALSVATLLAVFAFVPGMLLVLWRKANEDLSRTWKWVLTALAIADSVYCAALYTTAFSEAQDDLLQISLYAAVLVFMGFMPILIKRFDDASYRYFFIMSLLLYTIPGWNS
jgi:peptidoglycan/LPS O-acetylase OafA/YrhL